MHITGFQSSAAILAELGRRIKDTRIAVSMTQVDLAQQAGVSPRTVTNIESGQHVTLVNLMNVLRALGLLANFELLVPDQGVRPSDLERLGKKRQRATSVRKSNAQQNGWVWGEDR